MFLGRGVPFEDLERCLIDCGIDGAVLTATDLRRNQDVIDFIAKQGSKRYWFFPWINPSVDEDLEFLKANKSRIDGIKLHPSCDHVRVTDERARPVLDFASRHALPVMVHCGRWQEMSSYAFALEAAARYGGTNFILSHMGGDTPDLEMATIDAVTKGRLSNVYLGTEGVREYWAVQRAVDEIGADRVIFGSDFPLGHPRMYMGLIDALDVSQEQKDSILGGNISRLLGEVG
jgi:predicted TIM-barrel fold metal-dependent hydrolase